MKRYWFGYVYLAVVLLVVLTVGFLPDQGFTDPQVQQGDSYHMNLTNTGNQGDPPRSAKEIELPVVGSYDNFKSLLKNLQQSRDNLYGNFETAEESVMSRATRETSSAAVKSMESGQKQDYSSTNVQVQGVDEADVVKTDGMYIYQVKGSHVVISKVYPAEEMEVTHRIDFDDETFHPQELYVDEKHLVVVGSSRNRFSVNKRIPGGPPGYNHDPNRVKAVIYNIEDKSAITPNREIEIEGSYLSSRKIGSSLYLIANKRIDIYHILKQEEELPAPGYRDSIHRKDGERLGYDEIHYFPEMMEPNYLLMGGIQLDQNDQEMEVSAYLGAGEHIYASMDHLYAAVTHHEEAVNKSSTTSRPKSLRKASIPVPMLSQKSTIYKFKLSKGQIQHLSQGSVSGRLLNQFSMDEHNGYLRLATTTGDIWRNDEHTSKNNLYILDDQLNLSGQIEGIAPGEKIYSVRFMGDRGYMVTFRTVDPLFVFDLSDPAGPEMLGKLKIPGYSDYLHPYDENHLIGFGKDTEEVNVKGGSGDEKMAYYKGMKMALFDISDVTNPKEKFVEIIGDRGTESDLLHNHKALLFSREKNLLSFPVTVMQSKELNSTRTSQGLPNHGEFSFQGAYVYHIDSHKGFTLRERITHLDHEDYQKSGSHWYESEKNVTRILYIGDTLYTLSGYMIKAHDLESLEEKNRLKLF
jgi:inhibitor of cysteine peptidase